MKIHLGDKVLVATGKDRGKNGLVARVFAKHNKIVVEKVNIRTKHIKKSQGKAGQRIQFEAPIAASNVMVVCPQCSKPTRVGYITLTDKNARKQRICRKCKQSLDKATVTPKSTKKR